MVKGIEAAVCAAGAEAVCQGLSRAAEQGAGQDVCGRAEVWVIEEVEKLRPETKSHSLREPKLPLQCEVNLPRTKTSQHIASEIALRSRGRCGKRSAIEDFASGEL